MNTKMRCKQPLHEQCYMKGLCLKYDKCPMVVVQDLLSGKWKILILWYLSYRTLRFSDIMKRLPNVTQKMLTMQLRSLEEDKLIFRKVYPVSPPKVEYGLTEAGKRVLPILEMMHSFGSRYLNDGLDNKEAHSMDEKDLHEIDDRTMA